MPPARHTVQRHWVRTAALLAASVLGLQGCSAAGGRTPGASLSTRDASLSASDAGPSAPDAGGSDGGPRDRDDGAPASSDDSDGSIIDSAGPGPYDSGLSLDGDTTACLAESEGGVSLSPGTPLAHAVTPNPIVSIGKPATTTTTGYDASQLFEDPPNADNVFGVDWQPAPGESVTVNVGSGPADLLMVWEVDYPDYVAQGPGFGLPYAYRIDVSLDGATWTNAVGETTTSYRSREAKFSFSGKSYVRFTLVSSASGTGFTSMKIFDVSNGSQDTWLVAGSGPSRFVYDDLQGPGFGRLVNGCRPKYYPALLNISDLAPSITDFLNALNAPTATNWLSLNPDFHFWILTYGLGDLGGTASAFSSGLESAVQLLLAAGKVPILTHIQYVTPGNGGQIDPSSIAPFNAAIDVLVGKYRLLPSPDLYAWFEAHPSELCTSADDANDPSGFCGESQWDGIEPINVPSRTGVSDTIRLWAAAATAGGIYAP